MNFITGLVLVIVGMFTVGVGVASAQSTPLKGDACLLTLQSTTINLDKVSYIQKDDKHITFRIVNNLTVTVLSLRPDDYAGYVNLWRQCLNTK